MSLKRTELPSSRLFQETLYLLRNRPITKTLDVIHKETHLPKRWLLSILSDGESNPAVNRVEILYEYLTGRKLEV